MEDTIMLKARFWLLFSLFLMNIFISASVYSQPILQLANTDRQFHLSKQIKLLHETNDELTLSQVLEQHKNFRWPRGSNPNFGFSEKGLWLHTSLVNMSSENEWVFDLGYAQNDRVDFYLLQDGELLHSEQQGKAWHNQIFRLPSFFVDLPFSKTVDLYIRIQADDVSRVVPIDVQSKALHQTQTLKDATLWGMFYGGLLVLAIYNLTLFFSVREKSLLSYVLYISTVVLWQLVWGGHLQVLSASPFSLWLSQHTDLLFVLVGLGAGQFALTFLNASKTAPKISKFIYMAMGLLVCMIPLSLFDVLTPKDQNLLVYVISMLAIVSYLYAGYESYGNNFKPARYFIFAWSLLLTTALIGMFSLVGILPSSTFTAYCFQFGVFIEAGLFSLALMEKSRDILESKVEDITSELRNNMEYIEEQSVILDLSRKEAINASEVKSQFLANMSHEIRTPLNAIIGFSRELKELQLPIEKHEYVQIINHSAADLLDTVNDVLDFSKIESGELEINNEPFCPSEIVQHLAENIGHKAQIKGLEFIINIDPLPEKLIGDELRIEQVLSNLLHNAIKFTDTGYISLTISGQEQQEGVYTLAFVVEDTGIGIPEGQQEKLFTAFSQLDDSLTRQYQGAGLGLVICKQLTNLMHGNIQMSSVQGQGCRFEVSMQVHKLSLKLAYGKHPQWQDKTVAIMDNNPAARKSYRRMFLHLGAKVSCFDSIQQLQTCNQHFDFMFIGAQPADLRLFMQQGRLINNVSAEHKILLTQEISPFSQYPALKGLFKRHIQKPLYPSLLDTLFEPERNETQPGNQELANLPKVKVLAVDDMEINLRLIRIWLSQSPVELQCCFNGQEAVDLCQEQAFDLILMDVQMPHMDGLQATKLIRKTPKNVGTPVIAVTAHAFKEEQENLLNAGMDDYLPKPIHFDDLIKLIKLWCSLPQEENNEQAIDWSSSLKQTNQNEALAKQMLHSFLEQLPVLMENIQQTNKRQDFPELQNLIHGLHGLSSYTGVSKLKSCCAEIEGLLKQQHITQAIALLPQLYHEASRVRQEGAQLLQQKCESA